MLEDIFEALESAPPLCNSLISGVVFHFGTADMLVCILTFPTGKRRVCVFHLDIVVSPRLCPSFSLLVGWLVGYPSRRFLSPTPCSYSVTIWLD